jgi:hypothetical protein
MEAHRTSEIAGILRTMGVDLNPNRTVREIADNALQYLASELEAGKTTGLTNYLSAVSRVRTQSWRNVLLIAAQRLTATRVAGVYAWNDRGRTVKEGEKGMLVFARTASQEPTCRMAYSFHRRTSSASARECDLSTLALRNARHNRRWYSALAGPAPFGWLA